MIVIRRCRMLQVLGMEIPWEQEMQQSRVRPHCTNSSVASPKTKSLHWWCNSRSTMGQEVEVIRRTRSSSYSRPRDILCHYWRMESLQCATYLMETTLYSLSSCPGVKNKRKKRKRSRTSLRPIKIRLNSRVSKLGSNSKLVSRLMQSSDLPRREWSLRRKKSTSNNSGTVSSMSLQKSTIAFRKLSKSRRSRRWDFRTTPKMFRQSS